MHQYNSPSSQTAGFKGDFEVGFKIGFKFGYSSGRLTPSDSAHVLRSMADYAESRAESEALSEECSCRLHAIADRLRIQAQHFSGQ